MNGLMTRKEAADRLGVSVITLDSARSSGQLAYIQHKPGGKVWITEEAFTEYLARATHRARPQREMTGGPTDVGNGMAETGRFLMKGDKTMKYELITELYCQTQKRVTSPQAWQEFLTTACRNYRLSFDEQGNRGSGPAYIRQSRVQRADSPVRSCCRGERGGKEHL